MAVYTVSTAGDLHDALAAAGAGDRIEVRPGDYGDVQFLDLNFDDTVEIAAADPNDPPVFHSINLWNVSNLTFTGIEVDFTPDMETVEWHTAFRATNCEGISVLDSRITGGNSVAGIDPDLPAGSQNEYGILGYPMASGMRFLNSSSILIENTELSEFKTGIRAHTVDGLTIRNAEIHHVRTVPIGGGDVDNVLIESSHLHSITPWAYGGIGDHGDYIHFWTTPGQEARNVNYVIRDNFLEQGEDGIGVLGIYIDDNGNGVGFNDVLIENNVVHNANGQGVRFENIVGAVIQNNAFVQVGDVHNEAPRIYLQSGSRDILIRDNVYSGVAGPDSEDLEGNGIVLDNNVFVQTQMPFEDDFVQNVLRDPFSESPTYDDFLVIPDGPFDGIGPHTGDDYTVILDEGRDGIELGTHDFGIVSSKGIRDISWDFGDGTTMSGEEATHAYATDGRYVVTAEVTYDDMSTETISRTVVSHSPVALCFGFGQSARELAENGLEVSMEGDVELVETDRGASIRLSGDRTFVEIDADTQILGNENFSLMFSFQAPEGSNGWGRAIHAPGAMAISVTEGGLAMHGRTTGGDRIVLRDNTLDTTSDGWHQVVYTMSAETGVASLYLDGTLVDRQDGLSGLQMPTQDFGINVGNPFGRSFGGLLDDVGVVRTAVSADQVAGLYEALQSGTGPFAMRADGDPVTTGDCLVNFLIDRVGEVTESRSVMPEDDTPELVDEVADEPVAETPVSDPHASEAPITEDAPEVVVVGGTPTGPDMSADDLRFSLDGEIRLGDGLRTEVEYRHIQDIFGAEEFAIEFGIEADAGRNDGELFRVGGGLRAYVTRGGDLSLHANTDEGSTKLVARGLDLTDTDPHSIRIALEEDVLSVVVDEREVASADMTGTLQQSSDHGLYLGNPWGSNNFDGVMTSFDLIVEDGMA